MAPQRQGRQRRRKQAEPWRLTPLVGWADLLGGRPDVWVRLKRSLCLPRRSVTRDWMRSFEEDNLSEVPVCVIAWRNQAKGSSSLSRVVLGGWAWWSPRTRVVNVFVGPRWRRAGLGTRLVRSLVKKTGAHRRGWRITPHDLPGEVLALKTGV